MSESVADGNGKPARVTSKATFDDRAPRRINFLLHGADEHGWIAIGMLFFGMAVVGVITVMILIAS